MDEVNIFDRALTADEIAEHHKAGSIVAQHTMNENTGTIAFDATPNNNDGTINGATWTTGKSGSALYFHGGGQFASGADEVRVPHSANLDITGPFTIEAWIKAKGTRKYDQGT